MRIPCVPDACGGQQRVPDYLELELQVRCHRRCWKPNSGPLEEQQLFLTAESPL